MRVQSGPAEVVEELRHFSPNSKLFEFLSGGGALEALGERFPAVEAKAAARDVPGALRELGVGLVLALGAGKPDLLRDVFWSGGAGTKALAVGEATLALFAVREGKQAGATVDALLADVLSFATGMAEGFAKNPGDPEKDRPRWLAALAVREWAHLLACHAEAARRPDRQFDMLLARAKITNAALGNWPNLVGEGMVDLALAAERIGNVDLARRCFAGVRGDLSFLEERADSTDFPPHEAAVALFWLERACEGAFRLDPADGAAARQLQTVRATRRERGMPDRVSAARFGPMARLYLGEVPFLALVLRDLGSGPERDAATCDRYGCSSLDLAFYRSAETSHFLRDTVLQGVRATYDEAHQRVFAAIELIRGRAPGSGRTG